MTDETFLDIKEAAAFLRVSETSLRRWTNEGRLPCLRVGRRRERRFRRSDLLAFMEAGFVEAEPAKSHICGLYASDDERTSLIAEFLQNGLDGKRGCYLIAESAVHRTVLAELKRRRDSLDADLAANRLVTTEHRASVANQLEFLKTEFERAQSAGVGALCLVGDMWPFGVRVGMAELIRFESIFDEHITKLFPINVLCTYDVNEYSGGEILAALNAHRGLFVTHGE